MKKEIIKNIQEIRSFNRNYTNLIGVLNRNFLNSRFSLIETRILFEINNKKFCTSKDIINKLNIDRGYLSRILKLFCRKQLIVKKRSKTDGRFQYLTLTPSGLNIFEQINRKQNDRIYEMVKDLSTIEIKTLIIYMKGIENILKIK